MREPAQFQLMQPVQVPQYLDSSALLVPVAGPGDAAAAALAPLAGYRWAESLHEAVPRVLRADLAAFLGEGRLWTAPLPPGVVPLWQWRVEIQSFESNAARSAVLLSASWSLANSRGDGPASSYSARIEVPSTDDSAPALAAAHRMALRRLAERMLTQAPASGR